ncbi:MAG: hypothetical protein U0W40_02640 [Acidimicrobiia bacterium]
MVAASTNALSVAKNFLAVAASVKSYTCSSPESLVPPVCLSTNDAPYSVAVFVNRCAPVRAQRSTAPYDGV